MKKIGIMLFVALMSATTMMAQDFSDNFEVRRMDAKHFHVMDGDESVVNMGTRGMTIMAKGDNVKDANAVYVDATDKAWEAEANMVLYPSSEAGLVLMKDRDRFWGVTATYNKVYVREGNKVIAETRNPYGRYMHMRLQYKDGNLIVAVAPQKTPWKINANANPSVERHPATNWKVLATIPVSTDAARIALTASKKDVISVRDFWYRAK